MLDPRFATSAFRQLRGLRDRRETVSGQVGRWNRVERSRVYAKRAEDAWTAAV